MADFLLDSLRGGTRREQLAWAAGLFGGEGSFTYGRTHHGKYSLIVAGLGMTDEDRVQDFWVVMGVGNVTKHPDKRGNNKTVYVWKTASFERVQFIIAQLWAWLGPRRRAKAKHILTSWHAQPQRRRQAFATPKEVLRVKQLLTDGIGKRTIARLVGRSYGLVNAIKAGRAHGEAA
jgi:hypothetical protein